MAPPLGEAVMEVIDRAAPGFVGVVGRPALARQIQQGGRPVEALDPSEPGAIAEGPPLSALVLVSQVGRLAEDQAPALLSSWMRRIGPQGLLVTAELGAEGRVGGWLLGLSRKLRHKGALPAWSLTALLLELGVAPVHQVWPQGVGSWVLTWGAVRPLAAGKHGLPNGQGGRS